MFGSAHCCVHILCDVHCTCWSNSYVHCSPDGRGKRHRNTTIIHVPFCLLFFCIESNNNYHVKMFRNVYVYRYRYNFSLSLFYFPVLFSLLFPWKKKNKNNSSCFVHLVTKFRCIVVSDVETPVFVPVYLNSVRFLLAYISFWPNKSCLQNIWFSVL